MNTKQKLMNDFAAAFVTAYRDENDPDTRYTKLNPDAPEWMKEIVYATHGLFGLLPDDWVYASTSAAADFLANVDPDDWTDRFGEFADNQTDVYNASLMRWAKTPAFLAFVDEARDEFGPSSEGIVKDIQIGQYAALERICAAVAEGVSERAEDVDGEEE